ncbi:hypothetical protein [uncultured Amphritea sp.]|uniref:hypothetical protein n=1 Tax=uncultured Amphritea sp. TaxID=981605 RepID=UPI002622AB14|nr:hypothetical protein [uncultured Amphritea sp.]
MTFLLTQLLAMLPKIFFGIIARMLTESALTKVLENTIVALMKKAAALTTNDVDDQFVEDVEKRFKRDRADTDRES